MSGNGSSPCSKLSTAVHRCLLEGRGGKPPHTHHRALLSTLLRFYGLLKKSEQILRGQFGVLQLRTAVPHRAAGWLSPSAGTSRWRWARRLVQNRELSLRRFDIDNHLLTHANIQRISKQFYIARAFQKHIKRYLRKLKYLRH